jgi:tRNA dimethylallyltransferase
VKDARPFPIIIGPTAGGKTALAVEVAQRAGGEVVSADSILIYRGLNIGSAKPTADEQRGIPHHLIDIAEPTDAFSVSDWLRRAEETIAGIRARGCLPVVVGGTHLYVKALLEGLFEGPGADAALREQLHALPVGELRAELERIDPATAARLHPNDARRAVRAVEVYRLTGKRVSDLREQWDTGASRADCVLVGLSWPSELINPRINARVKQMIAGGLVDEARALHDAGRLGPQAREALGYKQLVAHFEGRCSLDEAIEQIKIETRRFAKNQRTWARRLRVTRGSVWIDAAATPCEDWPDIVLRAVAPQPGPR